MYLAFGLSVVGVRQTESLVDGFLRKPQRLQLHSSITNRKVFFGSCFVVMVSIVYGQVVTKMSASFVISRFDLLTQIL